MDVKYPDVTVTLIGVDGNAFAILGRVKSALKRAKVPPEEIETFMNDAMSSDYDHLLAVVIEWVNVK